MKTPRLKPESNGGVRVQRMVRRCGHDIREDLCGICNPKCWTCGTPLNGKSYTKMLDGSKLCDKCKYLKRASAA